MKKKDIFRKRILAVSCGAVSALAIGSVLFATVGDAWSYFTTYTRATGTLRIGLGSQTQIEEEYRDHTKRLVVSNDGEQAVYVRAKAFSGSRYLLSYSSADGSWQEGSDGYYYYNEILPGTVIGEDGTVTAAVTSELLVRIEFPEDAQEGDDCNVVVIYESVPVQYDTDGSALEPWAADWSAALITGAVEGGND